MNPPGDRDPRAAAKAAAGAEPQVAAAGAQCVSTPDDPRLAPFVDLKSTDRAARRDGLVVAEGTYVVERLLASGRPVQSVLCTPAAAQRMEGLLSALRLSALGSSAQGPSAGGPSAGGGSSARSDGGTVAEPGSKSPTGLLVAPSSVVRQVTGHALNRGVIAVTPRWPATGVGQAMPEGRVVLALDGISDPENVGALFRTAGSLGAGAVLVGPGCADPLYRRSVRVSLGHVFTLPFAVVPKEEWARSLSRLSALGKALVALSPEPDALPLQQLPTHLFGDCVLLVGAEGRGLSLQSMSAATVTARIEMVPGADSLNVAASAAIALYHVSGGRGPSRTGG
ncbi:MAG: RNA methyltransferase [Actinomycetota bacterium]|nr:RNA methyltransferase [Actinomycetota bacterium]